MSLEDREFVEHVLAGETEYFEPLVRKYNRMAGAIAYSVLGDFQAAEDVVQESFLKAFRALGTLRDPDRFRAWLAGVVRRKAIDVKRARRDLPTADLEGHPLLRARSVEETTIAEEGRDRILAAIESLPEEDRLVLVLKHMDGLSYREIAEVTGATVSSVESRLFRARRCLKDKLNSTRT